MDVFKNNAKDWDGAAEAISPLAACCGSWQFKQQRNFGC
jgi:hypothetical protein